MKRFLGSFFVIFAMLCTGCGGGDSFTSPYNPSSEKALVSGKVVDSKGAPIPYAVVTFSNIPTTDESTVEADHNIANAQPAQDIIEEVNTSTGETTTDENGLFSFEIDPGTITIIVIHNGTVLSNKTFDTAAGPEDFGTISPLTPYYVGGAGSGKWVLQKTEEKFTDQAESSIVDTYSYDEAGNAVEVKKVITAEEPFFSSQTITNTFDKFGRKIKSVVTIDNDLSLAAIETFYTYDAYGNISTETCTFNDIFQYEITRKYDSYCNVIESTFVNAWDGEINQYTLTYKYIYNSFLKPTNKSTYCEDSLLETADYTYNEKGQLLTERYSYDGDILFSFKTNYTYDENGNISTAEKRSLAEEPYSVTTYTWIQL